MAADRPVQGRQSIPIWSLAYFRFWVVKTMMRTSPVMAFTGTPIYNAYLRLMGAKIGRNAVISCRYGPVCADLLSIGDNTILRKDTIVLGYRAQSNFIHIGPVEIGSNAFVGEASVHRHRHRDGRRHAARPRLVAAERPARAGRQALSRLARGRDARRTIARSRARDVGALRSALYSLRSSSRLWSWSRCRLPILAYHFWDQYSAASGISFGLGASTLSLLGISAALFFGAMRCWARRRSTPSRACACCS